MSQAEQLLAAIEHSKRTECTTYEASIIFGVTERRIRALVGKKLDAEKRGRDLAITLKSVKKLWRERNK